MEKKTITLLGETFESFNAEKTENNWNSWYFTVFGYSVELTFYPDQRQWTVSAELGEEKPSAFIGFSLPGVLKALENDIIKKHAETGNTGTAGL